MSLLFFRDVLLDVVVHFDIIVIELRGVLMLGRHMEVVEALIVVIKVLNLIHGGGRGNRDMGLILLVFRNFL